MFRLLPFSPRVKYNLGEKEQNKALQTLSVAEKVFRPGLTLWKNKKKTGKIQCTKENNQEQKNKKETLIFISLKSLSS